MKDTVKIALGIVVGFGCIGAICLGLLLTGAITCGLTAPSSEEAVEEAIREIYPTPTVPAEGVLSLEESITVDGVKLAVKSYEIVGSYEDKFEGQGQPEEGAKFLWLYIEAQNVGEVQECLPSDMNFQLIYKDAEIWSRAASPVDRETYFVGWLGEGCVYPGVGREGWLLYEIPTGADPADIRVRFKHSTDHATEYHWWRLETEVSEMTPTVVPTAPVITPSPSPTSTPSPTPTPTPRAIGEFETCKEAELSVTGYEVTHLCPNGGGQPAEGAKFIILQARIKNPTDSIFDVPSVHFILQRGDEVVAEEGLGAGLACRYDDRALGNACWKWSGKLYPGVSCEGWVLFEVPEGLDPPETKVVTPCSENGEKTMSWRLGP